MTEKTYDFLYDYYIKSCAKSGRVSRSINWLIDNVDTCGQNTIKRKLKELRDKEDGINLEF